MLQGFDMDRQLFLTLAICMGIMMVWQKYFMPPPQVASQQATQVARSMPTSTSVPVLKPQNQKATPEKTVPTQKLTLNTSTGTVELENGSFFLKNWTLKNYRTSLSVDAPLVDFSALAENPEGQVEFAFEDTNFAYLNSARGTLEQTPTGAEWKYEDANLVFNKKFTVSPALPYIDIEITADFKTNAPKYAFLSARSAPGGKDSTDSYDQQIVYWTGTSIERLSTKDAAAQIKEIKTPVKYVGATGHYFAFALVAPDDQPLPIGLIQPLVKSTEATKTRASMVYPITPGSKQFRISTRAYFGPKDLSLLKQVDPKLDHIVDFGWFTFIAYPILRTLKWLNSFVHNYGVSIILLTLLLKVITYPLQYKSMKSMKDVAKVQPMMQKLKEKYKDDTAAYNREVLTLMKTHNYNPLMGCLPMFIQIPIFIALYQVLRSSIELYQAPFAFWIHDLSVKDPFYITPVVLTVTMFLQQTFTPTSAGMDPAQAKMLKFMPLVFGFMMINLASGLTLYMLISTVTGIIQQIILNKKLGIQNAPAIASFT